MVKDSLPAEWCSASLCVGPVDKQQQQQQNTVNLNLEAFKDSLGNTKQVHTCGSNEHFLETLEPD